MEKCTGGELIDKILEVGFINEGMTKDYMRNLFSAVLHCHKNGLCHRDLKPDNFLLKSKSENAEIKIIDFGLSRKFMEESSLKTIVGTA